MIESVAITVGLRVGFAVGTLVGVLVGDWDGARDGVTVGAPVQVVVMQGQKRCAGGLEYVVSQSPPRLASEEG